MSRVDRPRTTSRTTGDDGFALPLVLGTMAVVTVFALVALGLVVQAMPGSRRAQDVAAATSAAQAGVQEYISRLNTNATYYSVGGSGADPANPAFSTGVAVPGAATGAASFTYRLLTTPAETARTGAIRLRVTGTSQGTSRSLTATLGQSGYLRFLYFTDLESRDPALTTGLVAATVDGASSGGGYTYYANPDDVAAACSQYWYAGRSDPRYTSGTGHPYLKVKDGTSTPDTTAGRTVRFGCSEIQFATGDVISGPLHSNDALNIGGSVAFQGGATTSWGTSSTPAPPSADHLWRGSGTPAGDVPTYEPSIEVPQSNAALLDKASVTGVGCVYTGETRIRFQGTTMKVWSPGTTSTTSDACLTVGSRASEQTKPIPSVIYVKDSTATCSPTIGYPQAREDTSSGRLTTAYSCQYGDAFVQGSLSGQVTIATQRDVVITGNIQYAGGTTGSDVLGLVPNNYAWVYHPVTTGGDDLLPSGDRVTHVDAAVLALNHSFLVQNYDAGTARAASAAPTLTLNGVIAQKYRGPVATSGSYRGTSYLVGYLKDYDYDERLAYLPPPYFLRPQDAPWSVQRLTAG